MTGNLATGEACRLRIADPQQDAPMLARWLCSAAGSAFASVADATAMIGQLSGLCLIVESIAEEPLGAVLWRPGAYSGAYSVEYVVGRPAAWAATGPEAVALLMDHLFRGRNAHRVQATVGIFDRLMITACSEAGLTVDGVLRDYYFLDDEYHPAVVFSMLRDEYLASPLAAAPRREAVPAQEKAEARRILAEYLGRQQQALAVR